MLGLLLGLLWDHFWDCFLGKSWRVRGSLTVAPRLSSILGAFQERFQERVRKRTHRIKKTVKSKLQEYFRRAAKELCSKKKDAPETSLAEGATPARFPLLGSMKTHTHTHNTNRHESNRCAEDVCSL